MWHYLYFIVLVKVKDPTEYTGPESYVAQMIVVSQFGHVLYANWEMLLAARAENIFLFPSLWTIGGIDLYFYRSFQES